MTISATAIKKCDMPAAAGPALLAPGPDFERDKSAPLYLSAAVPVRLDAHREFVNSATTLRLTAI